MNAQKFGGEGSGGQSYRKYMWKVGNTYKFLLKGIPTDNNSTEYTAYFFAPEIGKIFIRKSTNHKPDIDFDQLP